MSVVYIVFVSVYVSLLYNIYKWT